MNEQDKFDRFEELEAGRILGDLDAEEAKEREELSQALQAAPDFSLEVVAAAIETEFLQEQEVALPSEVEELLRRDMSRFVSSDDQTTEKIVRPAVWQGILASPGPAWAVAALCAALFIANFLTKNPAPGPPPIAFNPPTSISPEQARDQLLNKATDLFESDFAGLGSYDQMSGKVVWSDEMQEGYMTLTNLPANNPTAKQYQLWIVDPARDEKPVDGGVFDIPADEDSAVIAIRNPLVVTNPQAFVITLEQPGGVVVSKQEVVVALAKAS